MLWDFGIPSQERLDRLVHISVPFRKFDEEVFRTLRGLRPHPLPLALDPERTRGALRREVAIDTAECGGEALRSLHCAARCAVQVSLRAAARGSGVGVEDDHGRSACSRGAAVKLHVEITSRS